jgi:hypothetical protein
MDFIKANFGEEKEFPLARAEYKRLYLDALGSLTTNLPTHERSNRYDSLASGPAGRHRSELDITFDVETEITGYMSAKLFMESPQSDDMHVFITLWKLDKNGEPVGMTYYAQVFSPPVKLTYVVRKRACSMWMDQGISQRIGRQCVYPRAAGLASSSRTETQRRNRGIEC